MYIWLFADSLCVHMVICRDSQNRHTKETVSQNDYTKGKLQGLHFFPLQGLFNFYRNLDREPYCEEALRGNSKGIKLRKNINKNCVKMLHTVLRNLILKIYKIKLLELEK